MFEGGVLGAGTGVVLDAAAVTEWVTALQAVDPHAADADRIDQITALETLKCAAAAAQVALAADFDESQCARQREAGVREERVGLGVAAQLGLARRESHHRGRRLLSLARVLPAEMPCTWAAFRAGLVTEWRATILLKETAFLSLAHRQQVDREVAGDAGSLSRMGEGELETALRKLTYALDPAGFVDRARRAESERRVTSRPAPDAMCWVTGLLPTAQGVAVIAALRKAADALVATGDGRTRSQIMADTLVERVTGLASRPLPDPTRWDDGAAAGSSPGAADGSGRSDAAAATRTRAEQRAGAPVVPVRVNVVLSDRVLLGLSDDAAVVPGHGPIPGEVARRLVLDAHAAGLAELRRLYATPATGDLVAMDSTSRAFPGGLAALIGLRDGRCRTPWCDAPVRHVDHAKPVAQGGETSLANGQGLCEACNYAKEAPDWTARPRPGPRHTVETVTPTGHRHSSTAPRAPAHSEPPPDGATVRIRVVHRPVELRLDFVLAG